MRYFKIFKYLSFIRILLFMKLTLFFYLRKFLHFYPYSMVAYAKQISKFRTASEVTRFSIANIFRCPCGKNSFWVSGIRDPRTSAKRFQAFINVLSYCFQGIDYSFPCACLNDNLHRKVGSLTRYKCSSVKI